LELAGGYTSLVHIPHSRSLEESTGIVENSITVADRFQYMSWCLTLLHISPGHWQELEHWGCGSLL